MSVNVDALAKALVSPAVAPAATYTMQPADIPGGLSPDGCVIVHELPGGSHVDPRFGHVSTTVQIDAYHPGKHAAFDLCSAALAALVSAWRAGTSTPFGHISRIPVGGLGSPTVIRFDDDLDGFTRYTALAQIDCAP